MKFKKLLAVIDNNSKTYGNISDLNRFITKRPYFLFAYSSQLSLLTILKKIIKFNNENNLEINEQIDGIFILDRGCIYNLGDGNGFIMATDNSGNKIQGYIIETIEKKPNIITNYITWLNFVIYNYKILTPIITRYICFIEE